MGASIAPVGNAAGHSLLKLFCQNEPTAPKTLAASTTSHAFWPLRPGSRRQEASAWTRRVCRSFLTKRNQKYAGFQRGLSVCSVARGGAHSCQNEANQHAPELTQTKPGSTPMIGLCARFRDGIDSAGGRAGPDARQADHAGGAVPARAGARSRGAADRRQAGRRARPHGRGREPHRRQRYARLERGRARGARRPYPAVHHRLDPRHRRAPDEEPALRPGEGLHSDRCRGRAGHLPDRQRRAAGQLGAGAHRLCQGATGPDESSGLPASARCST